jgi:hypothetical protein
VIIRNLDTIGFTRHQQFVYALHVVGDCPFEAEAPLIVDPDTVLAGPISAQSFETD